MIENIGAYSKVDYDRGYQQGRADALSIDMEKPMHFTDEQKAWIKNYIIINAKRQRENAVKDFAKWLIDKRVDNYSDIVDLVAEYTNNLEDIENDKK